MMRTNRMMQSLPSYYERSTVMQAIQDTQAQEYDSLEEKAIDLQRQLSIKTATWGLRYWEYPLGIPVREGDSYEIRRSRVLSAWHGLSAQFSAKLIQTVCEAFSGGETSVTIDTLAQTVEVKFIGTRGIPKNLDDLKAAVEKIVHAHLGVDYSFTYIRWGELTGLLWGDAAEKTWYQLSTE